LIRLKITTQEEHHIHKKEDHVEWTTRRQNSIITTKVRN